MLCLYEAGALLLAGERTDVAEACLRAGLTNGERASLGGQMAVYQALAALLQGREAQSAMLAQRSLELLPERSPFFRSMASMILALDTLFTGDDELAVQRLRETLTLSDEVGNVMNSVLARTHLAELAMLHNELAEAEILYREALAIATHSGELEPVRGVPLMGYGALEYERNDLAAAQQLLEEGIEAVRGWGQMGTVQACVVLFKVRRARGDRTGAEAMLQAADELIAGSHLPAAMLGSHVQFYHMQAALLAGDLAAADHYAELAGLTAPEQPECSCRSRAGGNVLRSSGACAVAACAWPGARRCLASICSARPQYGRVAGGLSNRRCLSRRLSTLGSNSTSGRWLC